MAEPESIGQRVKILRRELGLTQDELARRVGCAPVTLRKIEYDDLRPSVQIAERLAMALNVPLEERAAFVRQARLERAPLAEPTPTPSPKPEEIGVEDLSGRAIRGYALGERIGKGGMGVVYRAVQPLVEREVAIKIILPQYANHPDFIRRFEAEAQLVARLEHPHIVPLYDYWREPNTAFLVMRLLRGGSLQKLLEEGPLPPEMTLRMMEQIGAALASAHRVGVIHRDLKPANILLDEDQNAYLADFGIAKNLGNPNLEDATQADVIIGSPNYISPEQIRSEFVRPQSDIYCLGVVLYEMLTGQAPFKGPTPIDVMHQHLSAPLPPLAARRAGLPRSLDDVIERATLKDPLMRYANAELLLEDLQKAIHGESVALQAIMSTEVLPSLTAADNPYKGLRAFAEGDAADFFGRGALIQQLLVRMGEGGDLSRLLAVVGPSGSGKSSVVKAGLIPALRQGGLPGSENWYIVDLMPGPHPFEEIEAALLRIAVNPPASLLEQLKQDERGLLRAVRRCLPEDPSVELVIVIDQFEELFTLVEDEEARAHLLSSLVAATLDERSRVRIVLTLRADFTDRPLQYVDFGELMRQRMEVVLPLTPDELESAIVGPAKRVGLQVEPDLVAAIVRDVEGQPGALPLMEYALTELFDRREGRQLTKAAYNSIGGVLGALGRRAEEVYASLSQPAQAAARQLFLRLVILGEGTEDTRRRVLRMEVDSLVGDQPAAIGQAIDTFGRARLLSFDRDPLTRGPTLEVAHEALLHRWSRLRDWLRSSRADMRMQRLLAAETTEWLRGERDASFLLAGTRLAQFEAWAEASELVLTGDERAYLDASLHERQRQEEEERERQHRELEAARKLAEAETRRAEEQAQSAGKLRRRAVLLALALGASSVLLSAAVWLGLLANQNAQAAQDQTRLATSRELAAAAVNSLQVDPERSVLLALQALSRADTLEARNSLHQALPELHILRTIPAHRQAPGVAFSPDGARLASIGIDGEVKVWDAATYQQLLTLPGESGNAGFNIAFSPDDKLLAASTATKVTVWDAATGQKLFTLAGDLSGPTINHISFSPDSKRLAVANMDGAPKVWDLATQAEVFSLTGHELMCEGIAYSPDGRWLATGDEAGVVKIWDAATGQGLFTFEQGGLVHSIAFSPDSARLASATDNGKLMVWDPAAGRQLLSLPTRSGLYDVAFMPDGKRLATAHQDGTTTVWDAVSGQQVLILAGHVSTVVGVAASPDNRRIATSGYDGTLKIWDTAPGQELLTLAAHDGPVSDVAYSPDGTRLATVSLDGTAKLWDPVSGQLVLSLTHGSTAGGLTGLALSPDGVRLAAGSMNGTVDIWNLGTGQAVMTLTGHAGAVYGLTYSPDGTRLATASWDGTAKVWDVSATLPGLTGRADDTVLAAGKEIVSFNNHGKNLVFGIVFSPDGKQVFTAGTDGYVREWDSSTGQELQKFPGEGQEVYGVGLSPDGRLLAMGRQDGVVTVWEVSSGKQLLQLPGHAGLVMRVAFNQDGTRLASASFDGFAKVWDVKTGQELVTLYGNTSNVFGVSFSPTERGTRLATAGGDGTVRIYTLQMDEFVKLARSRVTRPLSTEECRKYLHSEQCPSMP